jgi:hypothetical protein
MPAGLFSEYRRRAGMTNFHIALKQKIAIITEYDPNSRILPIVAPVHA